MTNLPIEPHGNPEQISNMSEVGELNASLIDMGRLIIDDHPDRINHVLATSPLSREKCVFVVVEDRKVVHDGVMRSHRAVLARDTPMTNDAGELVIHRTAWSVGLADPAFGLDPFTDDVGLHVAERDVVPGDPVSERLSPDEMGFERQLDEPSVIPSDEQISRMQVAATRMRSTLKTRWYTA